MIAPVSPITVEQTRAIKAMQRRIGLADSDYRDMLEATTGKRSSTDLSTLEARRVIDKLKPLAPQLNKPAAKGAANLSGPYAGVCRAIWIAAYNLGVIAVGTDKALLAFVQRQTHLAHLNWMRDAKDAAKVIEALKDMIAREAEVQWECSAKLLKLHGFSLARWRKLEVIRAQVRLLETAGDHGPFASRTELHAAQDSDLDRMSSALGRRLRAAKEARTSRARRKAG